MEMSYDKLVEDFGSAQRNDNFPPGPNDSWTLADTMFGLFFVLVTYLVLVLIVIPDMMAKRSPFNLKRIMLVYNAVQVLYSAYMVFIYARYMFRHGVISTRCPKGEDMQQVVAEIYPTFIAKHLDLLDTVFIVLRKKDSQVTFLHLYHHTSMLVWTWLHLMYYPTDHFVEAGLLNSFVHVLMYSYYFIASLGPDYAKYVWWKKHLTKVQLIQFILVLSHMHYQQKLSPCPIPTFFHYYCMGCIGSFFLLFLKFYFSIYQKGRSLSGIEKKGVLAD